MLSPEQLCCDEESEVALRILLKTPLVTLIAVLSLGLGIGATTAIFSVYDQLMRRPLEVQNPDRLVNFSSPGQKLGSTEGSVAGGPDALFSYPMFRDLEKVQGVFTGVAAHRSFGANLLYRGRPPVGRLGLFVSGSYFPLLGLQPAIGRLFGPADDASVGESSVAVLQHAFWRMHFESSPAVLGQTLLVNGRALKIVGVAPEGFAGTVLGELPELFVPIRQKELMPPHEKGLDRNWHWIYVFARLTPGISIEEASSAANATYHAIINNIEASLWQADLSDRQMAEFRAKQLVLESGYRGQSVFLNQENRDAFLLMLLMTGMVLLIACANVSNLLLARASSRTTEMAVRISLGARHVNLVTQLLTESLVLAALGGAAGLLIAGWTVDAFVWLFSESWLSLIITSTLEPAVLLFAATVTLGASVAFGLFPAIQSAQPGMLTASAGSRTSGTRTAARFRWTLATAQIAISTALLIVAGLFTKSFFNVDKVDVGFNAKALIAFEISPNLSGASSEQSRALFERLEAELAAQPGVTDVTAALVPVLSGSRGTEVSVQGYPNGPEVDSGTGYNLIGPGYFRAMGIPLISGREFTASDAWGAPAAVIVNEQFAKKFNLGANPVGKRMAWGSGKKTFDLPIVGVVRDVKYSGLKDETPPMFFYPYRQTGSVGNVTFYVRGTLPEKTLLSMIPGVVEKVAPHLPVANVRTMAQTIRDNEFDDRVLAVMYASFAILATMLAAGGLYGVMSYAVAQRTREFGVRMALGAAPGAIRVMVLRQVAVMTLVGGGVGIAASTGFGRVIESALFGVKGYDTTVLLVSSVLLGVVAIGAGFLPAHRASKVEPMRALRYE